MKKGGQTAQAEHRNSMAVYVENETEIFFDFGSPEEVIKAAVYAVFKEFDIPEELDVNVLITTEDEIRKINQEYRNNDSITDVLSFPYFEFDKAGKFSHNTCGEENILGDIVLCARRIISQAVEYAHSERRELAFLTVHSMLHLLGFNHETEEETTDMESRQKKIMNQLGISRRNSS